MKYNFCLYLFIILFLLPKKNVAQQPRLDFNLVKKINGVTLGKINCITQDRFGYMWFADYSNNALVRFDGYKIKIYKYDPSDSNSLECKGSPECLAADSSGCIWINTDLGLDKFDPATNKFIHYRYPQAELDNRQVYNILVDHLGIVWVGTNKGLDRLDQKAGKFIHYTRRNNDPTSLSCDTVRCLYEDHMGVLWVGTGWEFVSEIKNGGLNRFNRETGTFTRYMHNPDDPHSLVSNKVRAIFEDSRGIFWVGTDGDGLHIMDRKKGIFERLTYDPLHPEKLSRPPVKKGDWADHISFITEDGAGAIWIGTYYAGIVRYDPVTKQITHYDSTDKSRPKGFMDNSGWCAYTSRDGTLWISTEYSDAGTSDLFRIDPLQTAISMVNMDDKVENIYEDPSGATWMCFNNKGLLRIDPNNRDKKYFKHDPSDPYSISSNEVNFIQPDGDGFFWVGTWNGLNYFDSKTGRFTKYLYNIVSKGNYNDTAIWRLLKGDNGEIYFSTNLGFYIMNPQTGLMKRFEHNPSDTNSIGENFATDLCKDKSGNLWVGTWSSAGLNLMDIKTRKFKHYLAGNIITSIYKDSRGTIWVGTKSDGLYYYNDSSDIFLPFAENGTEFRTAFIYDVGWEDQDKNIWGNSSLGIFRLNPTKKELCIYGIKFGINEGDFTSLCKISDGRLLLGKEGGYYIFNPKNLINPVPPGIILSDLKINGQPVSAGNDAPFTGLLEEAKKIRLRYNQNNFSIDFAAIHYSSPEDNVLYYMLERYDDNWLKADSLKTANYNKIPPGEYTLKIKAGSSYGVWSEREIKIVITPPWWLTWWFITAVGVSLVVSFYLAIRLWLHRKFRRQLDRTEKEKQLAELKQKASELEMQALRSQMNPHFIFNSLNSINMFILENNKLQASEYLSKFSKLIRLILQNSREAFIPLERELEALQLYLELESVRFTDKFEYKIAVGDNIDTTVLKVPPLIIQPYAENAIWHGLMHKKENGHLDIEIFGEDSILFYKITDDGIGRKKSAELRSNSTSTQQSMGMRITADRIAMLQQQNKTSITITDLVLANNNPGGTEVLIKIPVSYD